MPGLVDYRNAEAMIKESRAPAPSARASALVLAACLYVWQWLTSSWHVAQLKTEVVQLKKNLRRLEMDDIRAIRKLRNEAIATGVVGARVRALNDENDILSRRVNALLR